jgi:hypothetical protein
MCTYNCNAGGMTYCMNVNSCVDLTSDKNHCGSCAKACTAVASCTSSQCIGTYGTSYQLPNNNVTLLPNNYTGNSVYVDTTITVQKIGINLFTFTGSPSAYIAIYQADASGVLHLKLSYGPTSIVAGRNEFSVPPTVLTSGTYWLVAAYSNQVRPYTDTGGITIYGPSSSFAAPPDPFPTNANSSGTGNLYNYYFIGAQ